MRAAYQLRTVERVMRNLGFKQSGQTTEKIFYKNVDSTMYYAKINEEKKDVLIVRYTGDDLAELEECGIEFDINDTDFEAEGMTLIQYMTII